MSSFSFAFQYLRDTVAVVKRSVRLQLDIRYRDTEIKLTALGHNWKRKPGLAGNWCLTDCFIKPAFGTGAGITINVCSLSFSPLWFCFISAPFADSIEWESAWSCG